MINTNLEKMVENNYLLGMIKANNEIHYYMAPIAFWILDYPSYDPTILKENDPDFFFRDNLLVVTPSDSEKFLKAMDEDLVDLNDVLAYNSHHEYPINLQFIVDFDSKEFYSSFYDIDIHEYIPESWKGYYREQLIINKVI